MTARSLYLEAAGSDTEATMNASDGGATQSGRCDSPQGRDERVLSPAGEAGADPVMR
jgi:hypothetical protein